MSHPYSELGVLLKEKRKESGLTQKQVSDKLGYTSPQYISNYERGLCAPPLKKLRIIIDMYNIPAQQVLDLLLDIQQRIASEILLGKTATRKRSRKAS